MSRAPTPVSGCPGPTEGDSGKIRGHNERYVHVRDRDKLLVVGEYDEENNCECLQRGNKSDCQSGDLRGGNR